MLRLYDFQCVPCGYEHEQFIEVPCGEYPKLYTNEWCPRCRRVTNWDRVLSMPGPYFGEKTRNIEFYGGSMDTMGAEIPPPLPDLPGAAENGRVIAKRMEGIPDNAPRAEYKAAMRDATRDAPSSADYATMFESKAYKEAEAARKQVQKRNTEKRKRAAAMKRGENINMRRDRCAGDPKELR